MPLSRLALMKALGWMGVLVLIAVAASIAKWFGFGFLFLFGVAGALISDRLKPDAPSSAATQAPETERMDYYALLRATRRCCFAAMAIGLAGFAWETRQP